MGGINSTVMQQLWIKRLTVSAMLATAIRLDPPTIRQEPLLD
jgi:hypothetical protein